MSSSSLAANPKRQRLAPTADAVQNPDDWRVGVRFGLKALNVKSVSRAKAPMDVLAVCLQHNLRQGNEAHRHRRPIDATRTANNSVLIGSSAPHEAAAEAAAVFKSLGVKPPRSDSIVGVELVFQPPEEHDTSTFYDACLAWTRANYEHLLSAVVHRDQKRPHMHVLVLALEGNKLSGAALTSGSRRLQAQRAHFMAHMRKELGIRADRQGNSKRRLVDIFTGKGKGAQTRESAARSDAALEARARQRRVTLVAVQSRGIREEAGEEVNLMTQQPHSPGDLMTHRPHATDLLPPTSYCAGLGRALAVLSAWAADHPCSRAPDQVGCGLLEAWAFSPMSRRDLTKAAMNDDRWQQ